MDKNTSFFHAKASSRKKKNNITHLVDDSNTTQDTHESIAVTINDFFANLFQSKEPNNQDIEEASKHIKATLSPKDLAIINCKFTAEEVKIAVFKWDPLKLSDLMDSNQFFFQKF